MEEKRLAPVVILDAGAQYGKLIDRCVRELCVETEILPLDTAPEDLQRFKAIIVSGGPESVHGPTAPKFHKEVFSLGIPVLGICYGMQLLNYHSGGTVERGAIRQDGQINITLAGTGTLFTKVSDTSPAVLLTHGDSVVDVAPGFTVTSLSPSNIPVSIENAEKRLFGVQFHPETDLTPCGPDIFKTFLFDVAGCSASFTPSNRQAQAIAQIKADVGDRHVLVLVSGGVDSAVCAALMTRAVGADRVHGLHIDNGFMRLHESAQVVEELQSLGVRLVVVNAQETFARATAVVNGRTTEPLCETVDPELKRRIIGDTFMHVSETEMRKLNLDPENVYLAQGTLRPDLIESASHMASKTAQVIKTHHNDTTLVRQLRQQGRICEPLKDFHKDEVRELGISLGLSPTLVWRQPFPGPGLSIRIICAREPVPIPNAPSLLQQLRDLCGPAYVPTVLPIRSVGVQGDGRSFAFVAALFSADGGEPDWGVLMALARKIPSTLHSINRVVYVFGVPPSAEQATPSSSFLSVTPTHLTEDVVGQLQAADAAVTQTLRKHDLLRVLSQVPVILFPVTFGVDGAGVRSVCLRTFITRDFMTGLPATPGKELPRAALQQMIDSVLRVPGIARVAYDLTAKPPATTEWE